MGYGVLTMMYMYTEMKSVMTPYPNKAAAMIGDAMEMEA